MIKNENKKMSCFGFFSFLERACDKCLLREKCKDFTINKEVENIYNDEIEKIE